MAGAMRQFNWSLGGAMRFWLGCAVIGWIVLGAIESQAADREVQVVDKNCWIEVFEDTKYDADDPHVKVQGPASFASLRNLNGRNWNNDIESVIVGSNTTVRAYNDKDFKGTELAFVPGQRVPDLSDLGMSHDIESMNIVCNGH